MFTDLYDKGSNEIYEGDFLKAENGNINRVVWKAPAFVLEQKDGSFCDFIGADSFQIVSLDEFPVDNINWCANILIKNKSDFNRWEYGRRKTKNIYGWN